MIQKSTKVTVLITTGFGAAILLAQVQAGAHTLGGAEFYWCSPHNATQSGGGSVFQDCQRYKTTEAFDRTFSCAPGTPCANALCSGGTATNGFCGTSRSKGITSHGAKGGHAAQIMSMDCYDDSCI